MKKTESGENKATRQCWECLKRRLVCDHTLPGCKKCQRAGKECPGYDEQKPLQWVQPGKVTSRRGKKNSPPKIYAITVEPPKCTELESESTQISKPTQSIPPIDPFFDKIQSQSIFNPFQSPKEEEWGYLSEDYYEKVEREAAYRDASEQAILDEIFGLGGRDKVQYIVRNGLEDEAKAMLKSEPYPLKRLQRLLHVMRSQDVPNYSYLSDETNDIVQAVNYYNVRIHPLMRRSSTLAPNPALMKFPLGALYILPPAVHHTLVCLSVNHYIHSLPSGADKSVVSANRSKIIQHRGNAISALSKYVSKDKTRSSDLSISSILVFMSMELQNPPMADWRSHAGGLNRLIGMRGGLRKLMKDSPYLTPTLAVFVLILTIANTCSPSWDQLDLCGNPDQNIKDIESVYNLLFPYMLCPPALFFDIMRISQLRQKASEVLFSGEMDTTHTLEAHDLLTRIEAFSPEDWAQPGEHYDEWLLIGTIYQSAISIYCTMAFQSLTLFPSTIEMISMRKVHGDLLLEGLRAGMKSPRLINFMMWPLTVAGVEAGFRDQATRYWIAAQLGDLSRHLGTSGPLKSQAVLQRYWKKEEPGWDECFDRPYVFIM
ncbi:fungal-specific transcription factor domain-containing protein [Phaeosphaeria sp. MPI-PUGE-AT-0046c]|nr:fungal-specific transcription factor domain-containing protein [Phaeosphaeria sp. MPI-PUGE-AT-0046c]